MENIFKEINQQIQEINNLEKKRDELMIQLNRTRRAIIEKLTSKPYWPLFISGYCTEGDKEEYIGDIETYLKYKSEWALCKYTKNISISFENNKVIVKDTKFYRDDCESWTFTIPMKKFIEFYTSDDYEPTALETDSGNPIPTLTGEPARIFLERAAKAEEEAKKRMNESPTLEVLKGELAFQKFFLKNEEWQLQERKDKIKKLENKIKDLEPQLDDKSQEK